MLNRIITGDDKELAIKIIHMDCLEWAKSQPNNSWDSCVTDPPAAINFMGLKFDSFKGRADFVEFMRVRFAEALRILKPGGYALVWALPRTSHWTAWALEEAGFIIKDCIVHLFGSGYPKNYNIAKGIELLLTGGGAGWNDFHKLPGTRGEGNENGLGGFSRAAAEHDYRPAQYATHGTIDLEATTDKAKQWAGFGTALKPANEHWLLCQKPLEKGGYARNVLKWGVGGLNIRACKVGDDEIKPGGDKNKTGEVMNDFFDGSKPGFVKRTHEGRWPPNLLLSHTLFCQLNGNCASGCPVAEIDAQSGLSESKPSMRGKMSPGQMAGLAGQTPNKRGYNSMRGHEDSGGASRFFPNFSYDEAERALFCYLAKPSKSEKAAGLDGFELSEKVFNGHSAQASKEVRPGSVEDKFSTAPTGNNHPTVKSVALLSWLMRLITPPGGQCFDLFAGSGTGGIAALKEGFEWVGVELDETYHRVAQARIDFARLPQEVQEARPGQSFVNWFQENYVEGVA